MLFIVKSSTDFSAIFSPSFRGSPPPHVSAMETKVTIGTASASSMTYFFIRLLQKLVFCMVGCGAPKWVQLKYGAFHLPDSFYLYLRMWVKGVDPVHIFRGFYRLDI